MKNINRKNNTQKQEIPGKVKKGFRFYAAAVLSLALVLGMSVTAFAAGDPITVVNNLSDFIFGLIRAVGLILLGWGIVQVGRPQLPEPRSEPAFQRLPDSGGRRHHHLRKGNPQPDRGLIRFPEKGAVSNDRPGLEV